MAGDRRYQVSPLSVVLERVANWGRLAGRLGVIEWYLRSMRHIDQQLQDHPDTWGDPLFEYSAARLRNYHANHENFIVTYAIHMDEPVVFVRNIELLAGSPLYGHDK